MNLTKENYALKLLEQQPLGLEDTFVYRCKACGKCCKNREDIILTPYDVFRLARFLGRTPREITDRYCEPYEGPSSHMPLMWLRPILPDNACPFQRGKKCSVHAAKPCVCRVFPLARVYGPTGGAKFYLNKACSNEGAHPITVRDWIGDVASEESEQVGRMWTDALLRIAYSIAPTRYSCSANDRVKLLEAIAIMLYDLYDIKEPFLPQLERNIAFLIKHLEEQHSIVVPSVQEYLAISQEVMADVSEGS